MKARKTKRRPTKRRCDAVTKRTWYSRSHRCPFTARFFYASGTAYCGKHHGGA